MNLQRVVLTLVAIAGFGTLPPVAMAQSSAGAGAPTTTAASQPSTANHVQPGQTYAKPTNAQKFRNYLFDSFGPYVWIGAAAAGGIHQADNSAPEWGQGADAYGVRVASAFGVNLVATTTRYGLAEVFREDTIFYRCECKGFMPRLEHALISTVTARRGDDGHRTISVSNIVAPYAGTMTAALGWYPSRYGPEDGFRMGNYTLLTYAGINVAKEFIYGGPHTLMSRTPFKKITGSN